MTTCFQHSKEALGDCLWCGKKLCPTCIAHQDGRKYYCEKCYSNVSNLSRRVQKTSEQPWISKLSEK